MLREVYRIQPSGLELGSHCSVTSNDEFASGVHVCCSLDELAGAVNGWCKQNYTPELIVIECDHEDVRDNGDYEGFVLRGNRGQIVRRFPFKNWNHLTRYCKPYALASLAGVEKSSEPGGLAGRSANGRVVRKSNSAGG